MFKEKNIGYGGILRFDQNLIQRKLPVIQKKRIDKIKYTNPNIKIAFGE